MTGFPYAHLLERDPPQRDRRLTETLLIDPAIPWALNWFAELDRAVDLCYHDKPFHGDHDRVEFLFELDEQITAPLTAGLDRKPKRKRKSGESE